MAIDSPGAKSGPLLIFINKVSLEHIYANSLTYCLWLFTNFSGSIVIETVRSPKWDEFTVWTFTESLLTLTLNKSRFHHRSCQVLLLALENIQPTWARSSCLRKHFRGRMLTGAFYRLYAWVPLPQFTCQSPNPYFYGIWRWDLREAIRFKRAGEREVPMMALVPL